MGNADRESGKYPWTDEGAFGPHNATNAAMEAEMQWERRAAMRDQCRSRIFRVKPQTRRCLRFDPEYAVYYAVSPWRDRRRGFSHGQCAALLLTSKDGGTAVDNKVNILNPYYRRWLFFQFSTRKLSIEIFIQLFVIKSSLIHHSLFIEIFIEINQIWDTKWAIR